MRRNKGMGIVLLLCTTLMLSGCKIGNKEIVISSSLDNRQVFQIGDARCSIKEAKVYLVNYQNIYGTAYGLDLWQHDFGDNSLEDYIKEITIGELAQVLCMNELAKEQGIVLTEEELAAISEASNEYYQTLNSDEIAYLGVSESDINEFYNHYALAQKLYNSLTSEINDEVSDDEARVMEVMQIFVSDAAKATEVLSRLNAGEDFASVANNYNELSNIQIFICRDDLPDEIEQDVFRLDNNEVSSMLTVENGYYFIRCIDKYNVAMTEANKENIVEKREKEAFDDVYDAYIETLTSHINENVWNSLEIDTESEIHTNRFFEIFEKYCGDI